MHREPESTDKPAFFLKFNLTRGVRFYLLQNRLITQTTVIKCAI